MEMSAHDAKGNAEDCAMESPDQRRCRVRALLCCPNCHGELSDELFCEECARHFAIVNSRPTFLGREEEVVIHSSDHRSNALPGGFDVWLAEQDGWTLNLGAGATTIRFENCLEVEHAVFRNTDVVADAHALPFRDETFAAVATFNTFEHLRAPAAAAGEILRVLKPGGNVWLHTAFLQPLHEAPHHYFNATEYGIREWFAAFDVAECRVSANFHAGFSLAWLASEILHSSASNPATYGSLASSTLADWSQFWADSALRTGPLWNAIQSLPPDFQKRLAAGFELWASKPMGTPSTQSHV